MESNGLRPGMFPNMGSQSLGLEMSLHNHHQNQPVPPPHHHHSIVSFTEQNPPSQSYQFGSKGKTQKLTLSDDDDEDTGDDRRKMSPWQRMKWTDSMVRLLIMVVFYIGDEVGSEDPPPPIPATATAMATATAKKKSGGVLQKKGKWKSVCRAMFERGFSVSPQQCEDKFNDLNKRYKRVNDILGKGTACKIVENQSLLDSMDYLSPKMKDEVKKLLNSKHLFFREMCAYHNSCGSNGNSNGVLTPVAPKPSSNGVLTPVAPKPSCLQSPENTQNTPNVESLGSKSKSFKDYDDSDDDDAVDMNRRRDFDEEDERFSRKRGRNEEFAANLVLVQEFSAELTKLVQDSSKSGWEKREWMRNRMLKLEEEKVGYLCEALEIEKQRMKWLKFSSRKEREIETEKIVNGRLKLENQRMVLVLRQKEIELTHFHKLSHKKQQKI